MEVVSLKTCLADDLLLYSWQRLCVDTYRATYVPAFPEADIEAYIQRHFHKEQLKQWASDSRYEGWIAHTGGQAAGYVLLRKGIAPNKKLDSRQACLDKFYVSPDWQGKGIAMRLWQAALFFALQEGYKQLWLITWRDNGRAIRFYEKIGFRIVGTYPFRLGTKTYCDYLMVYEPVTGNGV